MEVDNPLFVEENEWSLQGPLSTSMIVGERVVDLGGPRPQYGFRAQDALLRVASIPDELQAAAISRDFGGLLSLAVLAGLRTSKHFSWLKTETPNLLT